MPLSHEAEIKLLGDLAEMDEEQWLTLMRWMAPTLIAESPRLFMEMVFYRASKESSQARAMSLVIEKAVNLLGIIGVKLSA